MNVNTYKSTVGGQFCIALVHSVWRVPFLARNATFVLIGAALVMGVPVWHLQAATPQEVEADNDAHFSFQLSVVGPKGTPVPQARMRFRSRLKAAQIERGAFDRATEYSAYASADNEGQLVVKYVQEPKRLTISIMHPGYGPYWAQWDASRHALPREFTAQLDAAWSVGGIVVDEAAQPITGVEVHPSLYFKKRPGDDGELGIGTRIVTDSEGKWRFDHIPVSKHDVHVAFNHPDYAPLRRSLPRDGFGIELDASPTVLVEMSKGVTVVGTVTDESGKPIADALVRTKFLNDIRETRTDNAGQYRMVGCEPAKARFVVSAPGRAVDMQEVRVDPDMGPVNFSMKPGGRIRIRVVDEQGVGIAKTRIFFQRWRGRCEYFEFDHIDQHADENGVWEWNEAPQDVFAADICAPGRMQLSYRPLRAREEEYVFRPPTVVVVSGTVRDAKTKELVKRFRVTPGLRNADSRIGRNWDLRGSQEVTDGTFRVPFSREYPAHLVRIEAPGYRVAVSRDILSDEGRVEYDFELERAEDIAATVVTATGAPAADAKIAIVIAGSQISVHNGDIPGSSNYATTLDADAGGRFSIPARNEPFQLVITHTLGFAYLKSADGPIPNRIPLTPWARVEGIFRVGKQPAPNVAITADVAGIHSYGDDVPNIFTHYDTVTGKTGQFVFERMFPGKGRIGRRILLMVDEGAIEVTSSIRVSAEFVSGKTTRIDLGGTGQPVIGRLVPPADWREEVLWSFALVQVEVDLEAPRMPEVPAEFDHDPIARKVWWDDWKKTIEGRAWKSARDVYERLRSQAPYITASVDRDGSFRIDDVPAGEYVLTVRFSQHAPGVLSKLRFSVPPTNDSAAETLDLGLLPLDKR